MADTVLELENLSAFYGESRILFDMKLDVEESESVCVLGRNGVGKSTTMKSIMGLMNTKNGGKVTGSIRYKGREVTELPSYKIARCGISYVPQGRHIFPTLSVRENLLIAAKKGTDGSQYWTMDKIFELFPALKAREHFKGGRLSGGEQQMLTIARGLMQNPNLLLMDEITEGLAPIIVKELADIINELRKRNVTILLAEQNVNFALTVSSRCYIIEKGHVVYEGLTAEIPKEILSRYLGL